MRDAAEAPRDALPVAAPADEAGPPRTVADLLRGAVGALDAAGVEPARLEAQLLLAHVLGQGRSRLLSRPEHAPDAERVARFAALLARRVRREPLAYLTCVREWRDLPLEVGPGVLIPRPETEQLAEFAIMAVRARHAPRADGGAPVVVDVGTGSGAIAIAVARACPEARVYATDSSIPALHIAGRNAARLAAGQVTILEGNLLDPLPEPADVVVANLPYIPTSDIADLAPELAYEPRSALDGGEDGLDAIRALFTQLREAGDPRPTVLLEIGHDQAPAVRRLARDAWPHAQVEIMPDLAGIDRFVRVAGAR